MTEPSPSSGPDPTVRSDLDDVERWVAELRADEAVESRARTGWLRRQAEEEATFVGILTDLAQRGRPVLIQLRSGRRHRGRIRIVGLDFCAIRSVQGTDVLVTYAAIAAVRAQPGEEGVVGDRELRPQATLAHALAALDRTDRRILVVAGTDGEPLVGELGAVGRDVVLLRLDGTGGRAYVPLASVVEVSVVESG